MKPFSIPSKLPLVKTTIFTVMSKLATEQNAINLSQGFPEFQSDKKLIDLVSKAMNTRHNQYAPMAGVFSLREKVCEKINNLYGSTYHPETEITITAGATQAIFTIISAFISLKDEVILFNPAYDCYEPAVVLNGGIPISISLKTPEYKIDWNEVQQKISSKTKMIIINSPHNPSGTILSKADLYELQKLVKDTNILILSDEVYEHIIFDDKQHQSIALFPELAARSFITASFGKTFHNTGWKVGYCVAPKELMVEFQKVHQFNVFCVNHPIQQALAIYLENEKNYLGLAAFYQQKRDVFLEGIKNSRWEFIPASGSYFQLLSYKNITDEGDVAFAKRLTIEHKVASIPTSVFYTTNKNPKVLRFCFAKTEETLKKATDILSKL
ncbi:MAG: methionine aminotransferase [Bacteroidetes bacterium HGW-Bacteroidetes-2]|jgi:methionine aminotransferase|nr:MAG: methionine aminotransferase [Bacteroidetes bacterium HGW-Bacteroidetes-2]